MSVAIAAHQSRILTVPNWSPRAGKRVAGAGLTEDHDELGELDPTDRMPSQLATSAHKTSQWPWEIAIVSAAGCSS
jgi:hypothetical protein